MQFDYSKYLEANIIAIIIITINICIIISVLKNYIGLFIKRNLKICLSRHLRKLVFF